MARLSGTAPPSTTRVKRVAFALCWLFSSLWLASGGAAAQSDDHQLVKAVLDATPEADCKMSFDGGPLMPCPAGSVVNEKLMPKSEAIKAGYEFVVPTGDEKADEKALKEKREKVRDKARGKARDDNSTLSLLTLTGTGEVLAAWQPGCPASHYAYLEYTASAISPSARIGVDIDYRRTSNCQDLAVTYSRTFYVINNNRTWYHRTAFGRHSDDPGCWYGLPHGATTQMWGTSGDYFESSVEHGCGWNTPRSWGWLTLN